MQNEQRNNQPMDVKTTAGGVRRIVAPEVGAIVEYGVDQISQKPRRYRVKSYLCRVLERPDFGDDVIAEILFDSCREFDGSRMRWCLREEATHLSMTGICGSIARVEDCVVVGMVAWTEKLLDEARASAERLGHEKRMLV